MAKFELRTQARALPSVLWEVTTEVADYPSLLRYVVSVEVLSPGTYRQGFRWREARRVQGRTGVREVTVVELDENRYIRLEGFDDTARYTMTLSMLPLPPGADGTPVTELVVGFELCSSPGPMVQQVADRVTEPFRMRRLRRDLLADAQDLAAEAERRQL